MEQNIFSKYKDNPNPAANIGFMCYVPLNFYVYKNIYKYLPNAEFIVGDSYDSETFSRSSDYLENLLDFFSKQRVYWRFLNNQERKITKEEFYDKYAVLVSTWYRGDLAAPFNEDKKLVRVLYGQAKEPWNYGPWSAYFDKVLSYGDYSQKFLSLYGNATVVGNPKFDDWFSGNIKEEVKKELKRKMDPTKKTILFLPTFGILSSLDRMVSAINNISQEYNIILKVHHNTALYFQEDIIPYRQNSRIIIKNDQDDILPLLEVTDFVIGDNSGAIFDAILIDKPVILIDFLGESFFKKYEKELICKVDGRRMGSASSRSSLEQSIKFPGKEVGPVIKISTEEYLKAEFKKQVSADDLKKAIALATQNEDIFSLRRAEIRKMAFSFNDGQCGKRAAEEITKILYYPKADKNFMAEALDRYYDQFITRKVGAFVPGIWHSRRGREEAAKRYFRIRKLPFWLRIEAVVKEFFNAG